MSIRELGFALIAIFVVTAAYVAESWRSGGMLGPSSPGGLLLGAAGLVLMVLSQVLYSMRKSSRKAARWGNMNSWLRFHVFAGAVGPYMALLHTAWRFQGLAGALTLAVMVMALSGFVGHYYYTRLPRTPDGVEVSGETLGSQIEAARAEIQTYVDANPELHRALSANLGILPQTPDSWWFLVFGRIFIEWEYRWRWWLVRQELKNASAKQVMELDRLLTRCRRLHYRIGMVALKRRLVACWHILHVPLSTAILTVAFVHAIAAAYYSIGSG